MGQDAITTMQEYDLQIVDWTEQLEQAWQVEAEDAYPQLRGRLVPAELFDEAVRLRDEFRSRQNDR